jgi:hypothetical protein
MLGMKKQSSIEGKDGNPLNEFRVLCNSILFNNGRLHVERLPGWPNSAGWGIKLPPERSLLKLSVGDEVKLTEADFRFHQRRLTAGLQLCISTPWGMCSPRSGWRRWPAAPVFACGKQPGP